MKLMISEVLQKAHNAKTKAEKVKILQSNASPALKTIFIMNYDESLQPRVPLGEDVPYKVNEAPQGTEHTVLETQANKFYYYYKGGADNLPQLKIESMFIQTLEGLYKDEAEILIKCINKTLGKKYRITKAVVSEAFPEITWGQRGK